MKNLLIFSFIAICFTANAQSIELIPYASGFDKPVDISNAGDNRLFVTEKDGVIRVVNPNGTVLTTPFLDIDDRVNSGAAERGLLGLTFHPDYANNGYFYVNYTASNGETRISRFSVGANPDIADADSELIIFVVQQPANNHNAGDLDFGPDGYLYFGLGDGGGGGDEWNNSQNPQVALGKMIRIDVDNTMQGLNYAIPADNPFVDDATTIDEIWALGLRNPWRFSFDSQTGDMWIADVGQDELEEIDFQAAASAGGENYGWRCYEGDEPFNTSGCPNASTFVAPIHVYQNGFATGCSVTGGFVYRGTTQGMLVGKYIYADYCSGRFWALSPDGAGGWVNENLGNFSDEEFSTFGEDINGELYVAAIGEGEIYRIGDDCTAFDVMVNEMDICDGSGTLGSANVEVNNAVFPINIEWSNAETSGEITDLEEGTYRVTVTDANGCSGAVEFDISTVPTPDAPIVTSSDGSYVMGCEGDTVTLTASEAPNGYGYQWYRGVGYYEPIVGATEQTLLVTQAYAEDFVVQYTGACPSNFSNATIVFLQEVPTPLIVETPEGYLEVNGAAAYGFDNPYSWYLNGVSVGIESCPGIGGDQWCVQPTESGNYVVCTFYPNIGCSACSASFNYISTNTENITGVNDIQISPIPANDFLTINLTTNKKMDLQMKLQNVHGQILIEKEQTITGDWNTSLNINHLPSGTYFLSLQSGDEIMTRKVLRY